MNILKNRLFNPEGEDSIVNRRIVGGDTTNLLDLSTVKYVWAKSLYHEMMGNFWIPEKQDLTKDKEHYELDDASITGTLDDILASLTFLDSLQTNNLPKIADYVTAPEITLLLSIQAFQEAIHSQSYGNIIQTIIPKERLQTYFRIWEKYPKLSTRNEFLAGVYQTFLDNSTNENFAKVLVADYIMEGLSFFMGFNLVYEISYHTNKYFGLVDTLRLIQRDEMSHVELFRSMILEFMVENSCEISLNEVVGMIERGLMLEKEWAQFIITNNFSEGRCFNFTLSEVEKYLNFVANNLLRGLNLPAYFDNDDTSMRYLESISGLFNTVVKSNFFETNVSSYNMWSALDGWNDLEVDVAGYRNRLGRFHDISSNTRDENDCETPKTQ